MNGPLLSVVLPCRDQADHVARVLKSYAAPLESLEGGYELVVVPNACTDATLQIVQGLAEDDPRLRALPIPLVIGHGLVAVTGLVLLLVGMSQR